MPNQCSALGGLSLSAGTPTSGSAAVNSPGTSAQPRMTSTTANDASTPGVDQRVAGTAARDRTCARTTLGAATVAGACETSVMTVPSLRQAVAGVRAIRGSSSG